MIPFFRNHPKPYLIEIIDILLIKIKYTTPLKKINHIELERGSYMKYKTAAATSRKRSDPRA